MTSPTRLRLPEILAELGWTQRRLSEESGISEMGISNLMNNPVQIRFETIDAICRATGKTVADLIVTDEPAP